MGAGRLQDGDDVGQQRLARAHVLDLRLGAEQLAQRAGALDAAGRRLAQQRDLLRVARVAERDAREEAVQLRGRQPVGAVVADARVLRRDHHERRLERVRAAVDGDLQLLHRLQQAGLGLRRGAVELVDEHDVGEHRAGVELELLRPGVPDRRAEDVRRQQVDGRLHAREATLDGSGERARQLGLADARLVLEQQVPAAPAACSGRSPASRRRSASVRGSRSATAPRSRPHQPGRTGHGARARARDARGADRPVRYSCPSKCGPSSADFNPKRTTG